MRRTLRRLYNHLLTKEQLGIQPRYVQHRPRSRWPKILAFGLANFAQKRHCFSWVFPHSVDKGFWPGAKGCIFAPYLWLNVGVLFRGLSYMYLGITRITCTAGATQL